MDSYLVRQVGGVIKGGGTISMCVYVQRRQRETEF